MVGRGGAGRPPVRQTSHLSLVIVLASSPVHGLAIALGAGFTGLGLLFVLIAVGMMVVSGRFRRHGVRAQGEIVAFQASDPSAPRWRGSQFSVSGGATPDPPIDPGPLAGEQPMMPTAGSALSGFVYRPTVVFTTADGTQVRATSRTGTNPRPGKVGDIVTVYYDPRNPQRVQVASVRRVRGCVETGFILMGAPVAAIGIAILLAAH
jgi:Protein of unknown function (DUF3592)